MPISKYHFIKEDTEIVVSRYKQIEIDVLCVSVHSFFLTQSNTHFSFDVCLLPCVHVLWAGVFLHQTLYLKPPESNFYQYFFPQCYSKTNRNHRRFTSVFPKIYTV